VITLSGDGGLAMLMGDLLTLKQHELPVKMIVYKNDALAFVELEMKSAGVLNFGTDLRNPDFAKIAEGAGLLGLKAETAEQVEPAIAEALKYDGPALVEVATARQELAMPPTITYEEAKGFSLFMLRAILNGRGTRSSISLRKICFGNQAPRSLLGWHSTAGTRLGYIWMKRSLWPRISWQRELHGLSGRLSYIGDLNAGSELRGTDTRSTKNSGRILCRKKLQTYCGRCWRRLESNAVMESSETL
jgi:hypothetical protein